MKLAYVCGPFTAPTQYEVEKNIRAAEDVAYLLVQAGVMPVCPHTNTRGYFCDAADPDFFYKGTMEMMRRCDFVILVPGAGGSGSVGVTEELKEAERLGMRVALDMRAVPMILKELDAPNNRAIIVNRIQANLIKVLQAAKEASDDAGELE